MDLKINPVKPENKKTPPQDMSGIVFGTALSDHMFMMDYVEGTGWSNHRIEPYQPITLDPSAIIFHYGQQAFEGMKAYSNADETISLFRPKLNFERINKTAERMCLPKIDIEDVSEALNKLILLDKSWVPKDAGTSLYIRPTIIATESALGLKVSKSYLFFIIMCSVGPYYPEGFNPVKIIVSEEYTRAAPGGVGQAKTQGNYAASNLAEKLAKQCGFTQVLWLDAVERKYIEEVGSMNIFFVINDTIITPKLTGTILPGITRKSVLELSQHWGLKTEERRISIDEVISAINDGSLSEVFGSGTAAVISPVGSLNYKGESLTISSGKTGPIAQRFFDAITGIQYGTTKDEMDWIEFVS